MSATANLALFSHPIGRSGSFRLRLPAGHIRLLGDDGETVHVRDLSGRPIESLLTVETGPGRVDLGSPGGISIDIFGLTAGKRARANLEILVPHGAEVEIETASADVEVAGLTGRTHLRTASGDLTLDRVAGELSVQAVSGDVRIMATGDLALRVRTVSGDTEIVAPQLTRMVLGSTSGDFRIDAPLEGTGPWTIETVSGDVRLVGRSGVTVDARTITGDLGSELPHRAEGGRGRRRMVVGDGRRAIEFGSVSGDLQVVEPRGPLPARGDRATPSEMGAPVGDTTAVADHPGPAASDGPDVGPAAQTGVVDPRLAILEDLEQGAIDVDEAARRLAGIEVS